MLGEVFHLDVVEGAQSAVQGDKGGLDALNLHALHQLAAEVEARGRHGHATLVLGEDALEVFQVFGGAVVVFATVYDVAGQWGFAQGEELALELLVGTVVEEPQGAAAAGGVVDDLGYHGARVVEEELVADTYLAGRLYQHIPKPHLLVELAQQEDLNLGVGLLLGTVEAGRENLGIVEDEGIALIEIVEHVTEIEVLAFDRIAIGILLIEFYSLRFAVQYHQLTLIASGDARCNLVAIIIDEVVIDAMGVEGNLLLGQFELKL